MATIIIEQKTTKNNHYYIEQEGTILKVGACAMVGANYCSLPFISNTYHYTEKEKAKRTYNRYIKKYN